MKSWQTARFQRNKPSIGIPRVKKFFANIVCAIPQNDAEKSGVADWFVRQTTTNILNAVASSTKMFLDVQNDSSDRDCLCMEFMNVLAAVSHCGFATETVSSMFESCMSRSVLDECNLKSVFSGWCSTIASSLGACKGKG